MAISRMSLLNLVHKAGLGGHIDFLREGLKLLAQAIMELEGTERIGAERYGRTEQRTTARNGVRPRDWDTWVGTIDLQIPKLRKGSYFAVLLETAYPHLWLDATYLKVRQHCRVLSMAVVVAVGVKETGEREILGHDLGPAEDGATRLSFLRSLMARGVRGVRLVISDAHQGHRKAIAAVLAGASWQRCRVRCLR